MKFKLRVNKNYLNEKELGKQTAKYKASWSKKGRVICGYHTNSLWAVVKFVFRGGLYAFKYPTTVTKTIWQVLLSHKHTQKYHQIETK